jgi:hypothetical protein
VDQPAAFMANLGLIAELTILDHAPYPPNRPARRSLRRLLNSGTIFRSVNETLPHTLSFKICQFGGKNDAGEWMQVRTRPHPA